MVLLCFSDAFYNRAKEEQDVWTICISYNKWAFIVNSKSIHILQDGGDINPFY